MEFIRNLCIHCKLMIAFIIGFIASGFIPMPAHIVIMLGLAIGIIKHRVIIFDKIKGLIGM